MVLSSTLGAKLEKGEVMQVRYEQPAEHPGALIAQVAGAITALEADQLWESTSQLADEEARFVVFDFTRVTMLTSAGIGILVRLYTRLRGFGGGLAIFGCSAKIREIIEIVMLAEVLKVRDTEDQAWAALES
jgi:anti-anti-sigma factor